jgi:tripartite-type tricarboxylate transporter receptor subunit TctC
MLAAVRALLMVAALMGATQAQAQGTFPSAPITLVLPFSAGGSADASMRLYGDVVSRNIGYRVVISRGETLMLPVLIMSLRRPTM